ncbi:MAG: sugar transferase [Lachnospiraceae bacterium]|jgi:exopolysaccharide biosynthesis polyprenyl glycosylphosphotransferase|nr:sugar transferase [Lachnospiraceae bacterium]MEE3461046.1 sugar transferase [Lachnospiraceae bacterium]
MKRNKEADQYKRTILFFFSVINVLIMTLVFAYAWFTYYYDQMYVVSFYRKGNYAVLGLYFLLTFFFMSTYGGFKIGNLKGAEIVLSQLLGLFIANLLEYFIISLLAFRLVNPVRLILVLAVQTCAAGLWDFCVIKVYRRIFQPWKMLLIYGERPAADLVYKISSRRDKYAIYDAVDIDEGIPAIAEKMKDFQAVIIGDISAIKRNDILKYCYLNNIRAYVVPKISDIIMMGSDHIHVFDSPLLLAKGYALAFDQRFIKRIFDIILSLVLLVILSPAMLLTAIAIKLCDGGHVFYKQVRCTQDEKEFKIIKFRSMIENAEKAGAVLATKDDDRITQVGKFIRATRIDELPQLINILKGDMSFVGPRPERPEIIKEYCESMPEFPFRNRVKAGLTGYAQVYGKYNTTPYDKLKLDLFYIENYSLWLDIKLILMTVKTVLKKDASEGIEDGTTNAMKEVNRESVFKAISEVRGDKTGKKK